MFHRAPPSFYSKIFLPLTGGETLSYTASISQKGWAILVVSRPRPALPARGRRYK
ncbi:hypothetical protein HMPREF0262_03484 [Clostridium sp. ATCC 29733]|nr:hypothetical protein HMPREF0262_03484 [Clostridium sp. ATCC 29733]